MRGLRLVTLAALVVALVLLTVRFGWGGVSRDAVRPADGGALAPSAGDALAPAAVLAAERDASAEAPEAAASSSPLAPVLTGSLVLPEGFEREQFRVHFRRASEPSTLPLYLATDGTFRLFRAPPGTVSVIVDLRDDPPLLVVIEDVQIPVSGTSVDPRLQRIVFPDLRQITLHVVDEAGVPIPAHVGVLTLHARSNVGRRWFLPGSSAIQVPARYRPQHVQVWSTLRAAVEVEVDDEATVRLPVGGAVEFHFRVDAALREERGFVLLLRPIGGVDDVTNRLPPLGMRTGVMPGARSDVAVDPGQITLRRTGASTPGAPLLGTAHDPASPCVVWCAVAVAIRSSGAP